MSEVGIESVDIELGGFTLEELRDIIGYIRSIEDNRPSRLVCVKIDAFERGPRELVRLLTDLWPDEGEPRYTLLLREEREEQDPT